MKSRPKIIAALQKIVDESTSHDLLMACSEFIRNQSFVLAERAAEKEDDNFEYERMALEFYTISREVKRIAKTLPPYVGW
jgi:hypothetical protein